MSQKLPDWVDILRREYENGASDVEVCKALKLTMRGFNKQYEENAEFAKLVDFGRLMSKAWWMEQGRKALWKDKTSNMEMHFQVWQFNMKNRFGWAERNENVDKTDIPDDQLNYDDIRRRFEKALPGMLKHFKPDMLDSELLTEVSKTINEDQSEPKLN